MKVIILAGGGGSRLFPLSRGCYPKQFLKIYDNKSLLAHTVLRYLHMVEAKDIVIVTNQDYIFHVKAELQSIHAEAAHILMEPIGRNTAPAIALAMSYCINELKCSENEVLFVGPSDHVIKPVEDFIQLVRSGIKSADNGQIVTLGIAPTRPETGYGYIEAEQENIGNGFKVVSFKEKPDLVKAESYIQKGNYYWNSGMFMFSIGTMKQEMHKYAPDIMNLLERGSAFFISHFNELPDISIDYAVAEHSAKMTVLPMKNIYWNDIGSFDAIREMLADEKGNVIRGDVKTNHCSNTMILGENRLIAGIGLDDLMIIDTPDVLLVARNGESQYVKDLVNQLKKEKRVEVSENVTMYRPWGSYTVLSEGEGYKVKKIIINPGQSLSLQMHYHRSEHWTVISGTGKLTLDEKTVIFKENESTYIPIGTKHRLSNPGKLPLSIIEVQNGKYLGEDDIVRFTDIYGRVKKM
ncbi:mannose-1-phosphate guanylyltransferase/mannose-6-phosphate isomerase [Acidaminococcus intestini]|uniref:mannose-1-phosphate guanylyltransferase/mannose-6-phosphate isomerase n=1 Tax=Acidaminococcus intestini TaxID=187327 RepID=UPI00265CB609|nr:mannose-1-phosphate guanylyltransferase/mannose-6-phosphate isomerase [Acidaminococcus intestini]